MNKRVPLLLLLVVTSYCSLPAQVRLGILGGLHSSKVLETNKLPGWDTITKPFNSSRQGFQLGVILEVPLGHSGFFFQPAFTYITKGRVYDKNNDSITTNITDTVYNKQTLNLAYMELPLNITYKVPLTANHHNFFFVSAGPYVSFIYSGNTTTESLTSSAHLYSSETDAVTVGKGPNTYKTFDYGVNGRAGFEIGNVMLSAYYSRGLGNFYNAAYSGTFHHEVLGATLGIWLTSQSPAKAQRKKDTDRDGVPDEVDLCPLQPGSPAWHGCPVPDTDHDGIDDDHDSCRTVPGVARYNGCPVPDTDHDGIDDEHDSCPTVPGEARYNGCPPPPPPVITAPVIKKEDTDRINFIAHNVNFTPSSDKLLDSSLVALDQLAGLLLGHPGWHLTIEGYTDNSGKPATNLQLSRNRAAAVKVYLVRKGIPESRLTAVGYGQEKPIADNRTAQGKAANRRVELKLSLDK